MGKAPILKAPLDNDAETVRLAKAPEKGLRWLRGLDLNQRPSGYEPDELPSCSTPRQSWGESIRPNPAEGQIQTFTCKKPAKAGSQASIGTEKGLEPLHPMGTTTSRLRVSNSTTSAILLLETRYFCSSAGGGTSPVLGVASLFCCWSTGTSSLTAGFAALSLLALLDLEDLLG